LTSALDEGEWSASWEDNIKIDHKEREFEDVDWIRLALYRAQWRALFNTVKNHQVS
jgi:hypothetical protein